MSDPVRKQTVEGARKAPSTSDHTKKRPPRAAAATDRLRRGPGRQER